MSAHPALFLYLDQQSVESTYAQLFSALELTEHETGTTRGGNRETAIGFGEWGGYKRGGQSGEAERTVYQRRRTSTDLALRVERALTASDAVYAVDLDASPSFRSPVQRAIADGDPLARLAAAMVDRVTRNRFRPDDNGDGIGTELLHAARQDLARRRQDISSETIGRMISWSGHLSVRGTFGARPARHRGTELVFEDPADAVTVVIPLDEQHFLGPGSAMLGPGRRLAVTCFGRRIAYDEADDLLTIWPLWITA